MASSPRIITQTGAVRRRSFEEKPIWLFIVPPRTSSQATGRRTAFPAPNKELAAKPKNNRLTGKAPYKSPANRRARGETLRHKVNEDGATLSRAPSDSPSPPRPSRRTAAEGFLKFRTRLLVTVCKATARPRRATATPTG